MLSVARAGFLAAASRAARQEALAGHYRHQEHERLRRLRKYRERFVA